MRMILASTNRGKYREMKEQLLPCGTELLFGGDLPSPPHVEETGATYEENALLKAEIPYHIYSGVQFYGRTEIKDALSYLRLIAYRDDLSFRCGNKFPVIDMVCSAIHPLLSRIQHAEDIPSQSNGRIGQCLEGRYRNTGRVGGKSQSLHEVDPYPESCKGSGAAGHSVTVHILRRTAGLPEHLITPLQKRLAVRQAFLRKTFIQDFSVPYKGSASGDGSRVNTEYDQNFNSPGDTIRILLVSPSPFSIVIRIASSSTANGTFSLHSIRMMFFPSR